MKYIASYEGRDYLVEILDDRHLSLDGVIYEVDFHQVGDQPLFSVLVDGESFEAYVQPEEEAWQVLLRGVLYPFQVEDERERRLRTAVGSLSASEEFVLKAPMPGLVIGVPVVEDQPIEKGAVLVLLESMKMQNELRAPRAGVIHRIRVQPGESVERNQILMIIGKAEGS